MPPPVAGGYAGVVYSSQGVFIVPDQDEGVGRQLRTFGAYEGPQLELLARMAGLARGDCILDIGANIGVTAVVMARAALPGVTIHAYEAQRVVFWMLAGNLALNGIDNARCRQLAIGAAAGEARVPLLDYRRPALFGSVELDRALQSDALQDARDGRFETVVMASVDSLHTAGVGLMKIDVEGMEDAVLHGAEGTIARDRPLLYVEHLKSDAQGMARLLDTAGYRLFDFADNHVGLPRERADLEALAADLAPYTVPRP
ncbi:MAG: FkbM family methyltransferase [Burkholderiales bacterium]